MTNKRISALQEILDLNEAAIITTDVNRQYFTDFRSSAGTVIITHDNAILLIDFRYFEKAKATIKGIEVQLCEKLYEQTNKILKAENITRLLIETNGVTLSQFERLKKELCDYEISTEDRLSRKITTLRQIKSSQEISLIEKAQSITDLAFAHILDFIKAGLTEREIALELEFFMRKNGSEGVAFDTICVSGKNSSLPHGVPTDKPIENGDFITMDFGARFGGYCSDMTRTVAVGTVSSEKKEVYETVLKAQTAALAEIGPNKICSYIDKTARDIINNAGFEGCFGHGLGHSVGLEIHEGPACNTRDRSPLLSGMTMTVEPGIYLENKFGVRIEDMVLITDNGYKNFTKSPKELIIL